MNMIRGFFRRKAGSPAQSADALGRAGSSAAHSGGIDVTNAAGLPDIYGSSLAREDTIAVQQSKLMAFKQPHWETEHSMRLGGARFNLSTTDYTKKTTDEEIILLKSRSMLDAYSKLLTGTATGNILEFGTWEGGSPLFFGLATNADKIVGIDLRGESNEIARQIEKNGVSDRVKIYYRTSQSDRVAVSKIIDREFSEPLDLVIDDASHQYVHTRAAFEIAFPRLRTGGLYIIEDWNWAHYENFHYEKEWRGDPALSNLALELVMAVGSGFRAISQLEVTPWCLVIRKTAEVPADFRLDDAIRLGRRKFVKI